MLVRVSSSRAASSLLGAPLTSARACLKAALLTGPEACSTRVAMTASSDSPQDFQSGRQLVKRRAHVSRKHARYAAAAGRALHGTFLSQLVGRGLSQQRRCSI